MAFVDLPTRSIFRDPPTTPHRVDIYTVIHKHALNPISPLSRREQVVKSCAESVASNFGINHHNDIVEKISTFESPEKWVIYNDHIARSIALNSGIQNGMKKNFSLLALRILLDAFLHKLGYRAMEWTEEERVQWEQKKQSVGLTRGQAIKTSKGHLVQFGFTEPELSALFSADKRTEMNSAAHEMGINDMVSGLQYLDMVETSRSAVEKAIEYVCGVKMKDIDPKSKDIVTSTGIQSRPMGDQWLFDEEIGG